MKPPIATVAVTFWGYTLVFVWLASTVELWTEDLFKETMLFLVVGTFTTISKALRAHDASHYFRNAMKQAFALTLIIEFAFGIVSFSLLLELVLQSVIGLAVVLELVAQRQEGAEKVASCVGVFLAVVGFAFLIGTLVAIWQQRAEIDWSSQALVLAMLVWLPLVSLPYVYLLSWGSNYGRILSLIRVQRDTTRVPRHARPVIVLGFGCDLHALGQARGAVAGEIAWSDSFRKSYRAIHRFRSELRRKRNGT